MTILQDRSSIVIAEDGTAHYERVRTLPSTNGDAPRTRVMQTRRVDAEALIPERGGVVLLPPNTRFHLGEEGREVFVLEDQISMRTVRWLTDDNSDYRLMKQRMLRLWRMKAR